MSPVRQHPIRHRPIVSRRAGARLLLLAIPSLLAQDPLAPPASIPGPPAADAVASPDISLLFERLQAIESREADRIQALATDQELREAQWIERIRQLEAKVSQLEQERRGAGILLPTFQEPTAPEPEPGIEMPAASGDTAGTAIPAPADKEPVVTAGASGFQIRSTDEAFRLRFRGLVQVDSQMMFDADPANPGHDTFSLRRARFAMEGTLFKDLDFRVVPQYGGFANGVQILDADLKYTLRPWLRLQAGKFKGPVGLEVLQPIAHMPFSERSMVSGLVPLRSIGIQVLGDLRGGALQYAAGIFNPTGDGRNAGGVNLQDSREFAGRLSFRPLASHGPSWSRGLALACGASYSRILSDATGLPATFNGSLPGYYTAPAFQPFFSYNPRSGPVVADGAHWRLSPALTWHHGPFGLVTEYVASTQDVANSATSHRASLTHSGWQATADWVLTGEPSALDGVRPLKPFNPKAGQWGAWQVAFRYSQLDLDTDTFPTFADPNQSAHAAASWSIGLNWWLSRQARVMSSFTHTAFNGGGGTFHPADPDTRFPPATANRRDEFVWSTRLQIQF